MGAEDVEEEHNSSPGKVLVLSRSAITGDNDCQVSHHHHDHNYGAADYVAAGAKLVVPESYMSYWSKIPGVQFEPVT
jgi:hypothetical protein